jgi:hypothetical protein
MNWDMECERWHQTAMKKLRQTGRTPFRLRIYRPGVIDWLCEDGLTPEGRMRLHHLNAAFRLAPPDAVLLSSDSWQAGEAFFKHYGIDNLPYKEKQKRYSEILDREYKGTLANVPDALKTEGVFTIVKGPGFMEAHRITFYRHEAGRTVIGRKFTEEGRFVSELVPDWWEQVVQ